MSEESVECELYDSILIYKEKNNTINKIDLKSHIYERDNDDFSFKIDFKNNVFSYLLKKEDLSIENAKIDGTFELNEDIHLKYNLGEETKEIIIHIL